MKLMDLLGNAEKQDMFRISKNESIPYRGKKKHAKQMSKHEIDCIFKKLKSVKKWEIHSHTFRRIKEKGIDVTYDDVVSTIYNSKLIEYHIAKLSNGEKDYRVLLRGNKSVNGNNNVNFVYSLTRELIVSSWLNDISDKHSTLDWNDYDERLKITII